MERHHSGWVYVLADEDHSALATDLARGLNRKSHPVWLPDGDFSISQNRDAHMDAVQRAAVVVVLETRALLHSTFAQQLMFRANSSKARRVVILSLDRDVNSVTNRSWNGHVYRNAPVSLRRLIAEADRWIRFEESYVSRGKRMPTGGRGRYYFVSYASQNENFADVLRQGLTDLNIGVWDFGVSPRSEIDYRDEIQQSVSKARAVLIVLTAAWLRSKDCLDERLWAKDSNRPVIWLRFGPALPPVSYEPSDLIDMRKRSRENGFRTLELRLFPSRKRVGK